MRNLGYISIIFICLFAVAFVAYDSYLTFYPFKVAEFDRGQELPVDKEAYMPGERIHITFSYEKFLNIPPVVKKELLCDFTAPQLLREPRRLPVGEHRGDKAIKIDHTIPKDAIPDQNCRIYIFLDYQVNPRQIVHMSLRTEEFSIITNRNYE